MGRGLGAVNNNTAPLVPQHDPASSVVVHRGLSAVSNTRDKLLPAASRVSRLNDAVTRHVACNGRMCSVAQRLPCALLT